MNRPNDPHNGRDHPREEALRRALADLAQTEPPGGPDVAQVARSGRRRRTGRRILAGAAGLVVVCGIGVGGVAGVNALMDGPWRMGNDSGAALDASVARVPEAASAPERSFSPAEAAQAVRPYLPDGIGTSEVPLEWSAGPSGTAHVEVSLTGASPGASLTMSITPGGECSVSSDVLTGQERTAAATAMCQAYVSAGSPAMATPTMPATPGQSDAPTAR